MSVWVEERVETASGGDGGVHVREPVEVASGGESGAHVRERVETAFGGEGGVHVRVPDPATVREPVETASGGEGGVHVREPDPATVLAFRTTLEGRSDLMVLGPRTRASYLAPKELARCVTVRLRPGRARAALGVPVSELVDRIVPLRELWGPAADRLAEELAASPGGEAARIEEAVLDRLSALSSSELSQAGLVHAAADRLPYARVPEVARDLGISERHLRTLFTSGVGVAPKRYARLDRVRGVLARSTPRATPGGWAALAADAGYYDQSHLTAEFRAVMGVSPAAFVAGRLPAAVTCSA
ncbi:helix-turn-helix domain-containing protein [Nonomuraea sp. NPDC059194]|uniref:helix-turn-helix domain-containing protein n=1 Tax=Nonomuraea sp. NPDC059194 TaxID=3346764 RepID=UPI0036B5CEB4